MKNNFEKKQFQKKTKLNLMRVLLVFSIMNLNINGFAESTDEVYRDQCEKDNWGNTELIRRCRAARDRENSRRYGESEQETIDQLLAFVNEGLSNVSSLEETDRRVDNVDNIVDGDAPLIDVQGSNTRNGGRSRVSVADPQTPDLLDTPSSEVSRTLNLNSSITKESHKLRPLNSLTKDEVNPVFTMSEGNLRAVAEHNKKNESSTTIASICDRLQPSSSQLCQDLFNNSNECQTLAVNYEPILLMNQHIHDLIKAEIAKHATQGLATAASAALSAVQEGKIKKSIKKIKNLQQVAPVESFQPKPVEVEFCRERPNHPSCRGIAAVGTPKTAGFAGFSNPNINAGVSDSSIGRAPTSVDAAVTESTTPPEKVDVGAPLIADGAVVAKSDERIENAPGPAQFSNQAVSSRAGGGGGGGGGIAPPSGGGGFGGGNVAAPSSYNPRSGVNYDGGFGGKATAAYSGSSGNRGSFSNNKANPFTSLFGGKGGSGTETFNNGKRGPSSEIADSSKSIWERLSGRYQQAVQDKHIEMTK